MEYLGTHSHYARTESHWEAEHLFLGARISFHLIFSVGYHEILVNAHYVPGSWEHYFSVLRMCREGNTSQPIHILIIYKYKCYTYFPGNWAQAIVYMGQLYFDLGSYDLSMRITRIENFISLSVIVSTYQQPVSLLLAKTVMFMLEARELYQISVTNILQYL